MENNCFFSFAIMIAIVVHYSQLPSILEIYFMFWLGEVQLMATAGIMMACSYASDDTFGWIWLVFQMVVSLGHSLHLDDKESC